MTDDFLRAAIDEARAGEREGGIPIGSVLVHQERVIGRGHNRRVQRGSAILHGEMDALENAGRQPARASSIAARRKSSVNARYFASGFGRIWNLTTLLVVPFPPSM